MWAQPWPKRGQQVREAGPRGWGRHVPGCGWIGIQGSTGTGSVLWASVLSFPSGVWDHAEPVEPEPGSHLLFHCGHETHLAEIVTVEFRETSRVKPRTQQALMLSLWPFLRTREGVK